MSASDVKTPGPTASLTPQQIAFFHREGYLSVGELSTPDELAMMRGVYDRIFSNRAGRERGDQFDLGGDDEEGKEAVLPQILNPDKYAPEFTRTLLAANVKHISEQLLGPGGSCGGGHAILKPAFHGATTPWHQDAAYWNPAFRQRSISIWIPLQDVTIENGCMQFVPGSQKLNILPHQSINNDPRVHGLELKKTPETDRLIEQAVACPLPAGGATIHGGHMLHYAGPNLTAVPRRAYIMGYSLPAMPLDQPRHAPWLEEKQTARAQRAQATQTKEADAK